MTKRRATSADLPASKRAPVDTNAAIQIALRRASAVLIEKFSQDYNSSRKDDKSLVTEADLEAHDAIEKFLKSTFPDMPVDSEEFRLPETDRASGYWIVDPLDGTENYASLSPHFGVAIGLVTNGEITAGGIAQPFTETYWTFAENSAPLWNERPFPVVAPEPDVSRSRVAFIPTYQSKQEAMAYQARAAIYKHCRRLIDTWSPSLDWAYLAAGRIDGIVSYGDESNFQDHDALIGKALFERVWGEAAHIERYPIPKNNGGQAVLEIASASSDLVLSLKKCVLEGEFSGRVKP